MIQGSSVAGCANCKKMEQHNKVSGRQKQLLKVGIRTDNFAKTLASSPWLEQFEKTFTGNDIDLMPQDWQVDLGNYCNSACVFCYPFASSKLATEFVKLGLINELPPAAWCDDPELLDKFVTALKASKKTKYIHFIGGETVITPAFRTILQAMIDSGLNHSVTIGFTTNLTVWNTAVNDLLKQFANVHLGVSIECFHPVNDYARWPSNIGKVTDTLNQWVELAKQQSWLVQIRTTPTLLTIGHLLSVYDYAWEKKIAIESCNFLNEPMTLKPSVLPMKQRLEIMNLMNQWIQQHGQADQTIINIRNPNFAHQQVIQDLQSYVNYLANEPDESFRLPDTVKYLKLLESNRKNSVLNYLPEYEHIFRAAGY